MNVARVRSALQLVFALIGALILGTGLAAGAEAPHVATGVDSDACAMCHRSHASSSMGGRFQIGSEEPTGSALLVGTGTNSELCYSCHGAEMLGSSSDVQSSFEATSAHPLDTTSTAFGPESVTCGTCHDTHGTSKTASGTPYPALLRRYVPSEPTQTVYGGNEYCATCHKARAGSMWKGLAVWNQTAHAASLTVEPGGPQIVCTACHDPHGSALSPLVRERLTPPSAPDTYTVTSNDRQLCFGCHEQATRTYTGETAYAVSSHAASNETIAIDAEWAKDGETMRVGECDVCHNPMGSTDASGAILPRMVRKHESDLCFECHDGSKDGLDMRQFEYPQAQSSTPEIAAVWDPERIPEVFTTVSAFAAEMTGATPRALFGPREWPVEARTGNASHGDVDSSGTDDLLVADTDNDQLLLYRRDAMNGLRSTASTLPFTPSFAEVGDFVDDVSGRPEIAVITRAESSPFASDLRLLRFDGSGFAVIDGPFAVGQDVTGIASGDVTGTSDPDIVITSAGDQALRIATDSLFGPAELTLSPAYPTRKGPRGPSVGDAWDNGGTENEIVVANSQEVTGTLSVFTGTGQVLASYNATAAAGVSAWDTLVSDVVPQFAGAETIVAMRHPTGISSVLVHSRSGGGGLSLEATHDTGTKYNSASLASGDVDLDGMSELVVGNAGYWGYGVPGVLGVAPSVQSISLGQSGAGSVTSQTVRAGGAELAGGEPDVVVADLGPIGHSGHPTEGAKGAHVSTETAGFAQHAECVDCHNTHAGSQTTTYSPPYAPTTNRGTRGVNASAIGTAPLAISEVASIAYEYQLCYKCHSSWTQPAGSWLDVASEFDTRNASFHGIAFGGTNADVPAASFVSTTPAWTNDSVMLCTTCHTNADPGEPRGPHDSHWSPMLAAPYSGVSADDPSLLCYRCHRSAVFTSSSEPTSSSNFTSADLAQPRLHYTHVDRRGFTCIACHTNHGSTGKHLVRNGLDWFEYPDGGACYTPCHPGAVANTYSRVPVPAPSNDFVPTSFAVTSGTLKSGNLASLGVIDGDYVNAGTVTSPPSVDISLDYTTVTGTPTSLNVYGRYTSPRRLAVYLWNYNTSRWVEIGRLPDTAIDSLFTYPLADATPYLSGTQMQIRLASLGKGTAGYDLFLDRIWLAR